MFPRSFPSPNGNQTFGNVAVLTSSGTWTVPPGITKLRMTVVGGGGAPGNGTGAVQIGGGGAGTAIKYLPLVPSGTVFTVAVGAAGVAGGAGGQSSVSAPGFTTVLANGGPGSSVSAGGTASGGDINIQGQGGGQVNGTTLGGWGGSSLLGLGSAPQSGNTLNATGYGAGAAGGGSSSTVVASSTPGVVIFEY